MTAELTTADTAALVMVESRPLDENPAAGYLAGLSSEAGRRAMRVSLNGVAAILGIPEVRSIPYGRKKQGDNVAYLSVPWAALRFQHTAAIRARLAEHRASATANLALAALRGTLKATSLLGQMSAEDYQRAVNLQPVHGEALLACRGLEPGELRALLGACARDTSAAGVRDAGLLGVFYGGGLRRSEAAITVQFSGVTSMRDGGRGGAAYLTVRAVTALQSGTITTPAAGDPPWARRITNGSRNAVMVVTGR